MVTFASKTMKDGVHNMIAKIAIHPDQIRWYVQSALSGFETLGPEDAVDNALHDLRRILAYLDSLDAANEAVLVAGLAGIKAGIRLELCVRDGDGSDQANLKDSGLPLV